MPKIIPHNRLTFGDAECESIVRAVRSGQWAQGPRVAELEAKLAEISGVQHAVCVGSGLAALRLALGSLGVGAGNLVFVPAYSCVALANAALSWDATPVPIDICDTNWNIDPTACERQATAAAPQAIIAVNTFGAPAQIERIARIGAPVIEDCAHAFGTSARSKPLGSRAQIGVLSFYATKLIAGGEGGAILTDSVDIADYVRSARDYGDQPADPHRLNDKMTDLEAALVLAQLQRLPKMIESRRAIAERYLDLLSRQQANTFRLPANDPGRIWYRFAIEMLRVPAEKVVSDLLRFGVYAAAPVTDWRGADAPSAPVSDRAYRSLVSLPIYPTLTEDEQNTVVESVLRLCEEYARA